MGSRWQRVGGVERPPSTVFDAAALLAASAWRKTLAANLATAGALELARRTGGPHRVWRDAQMEGNDYDEPWRPGCGRPAPGWER